jgi:hypothetical protein
MIGRVVKRVLHRLVRVLVLNRAVGVVFGLVVFAALGFGIYSLVSGMSLPVALPRGSAASSSSAAESFLKGNQTYDATLVWDSLSDESHKRFEAAGGQQAIQAQLNAARDRGIKFEQVSYIGKQDLPDGTSMQFFLVARRTPLTGSQVEYVPYVFTIDQSGKIANVQ